MSKKQKTSPKTRKKRSGGGMLVGIFIGLMLGAAVAVGAAWYFTQNTPFKNNGQQTEGSTLPMNPPDRPIALPGRPGGKPVEKPQFDFYQILPQGENAAVPSPRPAATNQAAAQRLQRLYLQAGAFENPSEADNVKARLALMGVEASVSRAEVEGKGTVHRVRIGPFGDEKSLDRARREMASAGIDTSPVRIR